jgi:uncharacterized protein with HEPN domain
VTKDPRVYLAHILECVQKIELFTADGKGRFMRDGMVQDAVMRNFEIIGEAAKRLDNSYRTAHPEIPWRALAGLRDVLIHQYEGVEPERVWAIVEGELPNFREAITALLPPLDQLERELAGEEDAPEQKR